MTKVLLDTNVLVYSIDERSQFYLETKKFLENLIQSKVKIYIPDKVLYELYRVLSSPVFIKRIGSLEAKKIWRNFAFSPFFKTIYSDEKILKVTDKLLDKFPDTHIFDLQIMACGLVFKADTIYTKNLKDFPTNLETKVVDPTV